MTKISALSDIGTSVASNDTFVLVDVSDPTTPNKKIQQQNLFLIPDGSAGTPAVRFLNDTDVGLFRPTTNTLALATGGSERLRIDSSGRVGIGTSSPSGTLEVGAVSGTVTAGDLTVTTGSTTATVTIGRLSSTGNDNTIFNIRNRVGTSALYMNSGNGRVGIGTTSPSFFTDIGSSTGTLDDSAVGVRVRRSGASNSWVQINSVGALATIDSVAPSPVVRFRTSTDGSAFSERARIDSSGRLLVGTSSAVDNFSKLQVADVTGLGINLSHFTNTASAGSLAFYKSRSSTVGTNTLVSANDRLGSLSFGGADGTNYIGGASISAFVDGTPGTNDMPGRLVFSTTADGASSPTERMRIDSSGRMMVGTSSSSATGTAVIQADRTQVIGRSATNVAASSTASIVLSASTGLYHGFLSVSVVDSANASVSTSTTYSIFGRGATSSIQQIATNNGTGGARAFSVATPASMTIEVTNNAASNSNVYISFFGSLAA